MEPQSRFRRLPATIARETGSGCYEDGKGGFTGFCALCGAPAPKWAVADLTKLISVSSAEVQGTLRAATSISGDGRFVAFASAATNLVPNDTNGRIDVFVRDRLTGTTRRVSVDSAGVQGNGGSDEPAISGNGRFVAFTSAASNWAAAPKGPHRDVFVHDTVTRVTAKVKTLPVHRLRPR